MRNRDFQSVRRFKRRRLTELLTEYLTRRSCTAHRKCGMAPRMLNININRILAIERVFCILSTYRLKLTYQKVFPHREMRLRSIFASSRIMLVCTSYLLTFNDRQHAHYLSTSVRSLLLDMHYTYIAHLGSRVYLDVTKNVEYIFTLNFTLILNINNNNW